jgi:S-adenosylmethionine/arginine decarboxylase-like enzyme
MSARSLHSDVVRDALRFGQHLVMDLEGCDLAAITSRTTLERWVIPLVDEVLKMKRYGEAAIEHFGHEDPVTSGYTVVQLIETSSITAHFSDHLRTAHIDVFSCRNFDNDAVLAFCEETFGAQSTTWTVLGR